MYKFDYHIHTNYSTDSSETMENAILSAINKGLDEIALTDHMDFLEDGSLILGNYDYSLYIEKFEELKKKYQDKIKLILGAELGLSTHLKKPIREIVDKYPFEFIIGSTHDCYGEDLYFSKKFYENKTKEEAYYDYFNHVYKTVELFDEFCVYGHLDYIRRYGGYKENSLEYEEYKEIIDKILIGLIEKNRGLEVNTSGFRYGLNQVHPSEKILKRYKKLGGEILTIGSDAHRASDIMCDFEIAVEIIKNAGFKRMTVFRERKPEFIEI